MWAYRYCAWVILSVLSQSMYADPNDAAVLESQDNINNSVKTFLESQIQGQVSGRLQIDVGHLDARMRLAKCSQPLEAYLPAGNQPLRTSTIGLTCRGEVPWSAYIPVKVLVFNNVVTAAQPLGNGFIVTERDITVSEKDISKLSGGFFQSPAEVVGKQLKTNLMVGSTITPRDLKEPVLVNKGDVVVILARMKGLTVTGQGVAIESGAKGDLIRVQNKKSNKTVTASITGSREVEVHVSNN